MGVENAKPPSILRALRGATPSYGPSRKEFSLQELQSLGLANAFDGKLVSACLRLSSTVQKTVECLNMPQKSLG